MDSTRFEHRRAALVRILFATLALGLALFSSTNAHAAGSVSMQTTSPEEVNGRWKLVFTIKYGGKPDVAYVPMIFSFTPTVLYERSLTDQSPEKPVITRMPLKGQPSINESMDVSFSNPSGGVYDTTKFDIPLRRDKGYEAGEYDLKITRAGDGVQVGQTIKLTLKGDNPIVDRRAIVFSGEKKKKPEEKKDEGSAEKKEGEGTSEASGSSESAGSSEASAESTPTEAPPATPPKQGGCGCRVAGAEEKVPGLAALSLLFGVAVLARRRRTFRA